MSTPNADGAGAIAEALTATARKLFFDPARLYHIGLCVADIDAAVAFHEEVLGIGPFERREVTFDNATYYGKTAGYRGSRAFAQLGAMTLELIGLVDGPTIQADYMDKKGEGLHHLGFEVDDLKACMAEGERRGLIVTQSFMRADGSGFAYFDSDRVGGLTIEVVQKMKPKP